MISKVPFRPKQFCDSMISKVLLFHPISLIIAFKHIPGVSTARPFPVVVLHCGGLVSPTWACRFWCNELLQGERDLLPTEPVHPWGAEQCRHDLGISITASEKPCHEQGRWASVQCPLPSTVPVLEPANWAPAVRHAASLICVMRGCWQVHRALLGWRKHLGWQQVASVLWQETSTSGLWGLF